MASEREMSMGSSMTEARVVFLDGLTEKVVSVAGASRSRPHPRQLQIRGDGGLDAPHRGGEHDSI